MAEDVLHDLYIDPCLAHSRGEGMAKRMATESSDNFSAVSEGKAQVVFPMDSDSLDHGTP